MTVKNTLERFKAKEREKRSNHILDAAQRVFATRPFDKVSMREIAEEAGIATSSIYTYFPNQEKLFLEATLREINLLIKTVNRISLEEITEAKKLEKIINTFLEYIAKNESYFRMMTMFMAQGTLSEGSMNSLNDMMRQFFDVLDDLFTKIGYKGKVRNLSHFFFATLNGILVTYRRLPGFSERQVIRHIKELGHVMKDLIVSSSTGTAGGGE